MIAPRTSTTFVALALTASVAIILSACESQTTEPSRPDPPEFQMTISVTPDTARPQDSVLVQTVVHNTGGGYKPLGSVILESLTLAERHWVTFSLDVQFLAEGQADTLEVWCPLNGWPAPDSVQVAARIGWLHDCNPEGPIPDLCTDYWVAADTLVVVP